MKLDNPAMFALAGNATFTLVSLKTQARYTYRVRQAENNAQMYFVSVLTGPDNTSDYRYLGFMRRGVYFHGTRKSTIAAEAPSAKAFDWWWRMAVQARETPNLEVHHMGRCGRCNRPLTVPESIRSGYGPECSGKMGI